MSGYIALSYWDIVLAAVFLVLNAGLSLALRLDLERQLLIAAGRMVVQLLMVGLILKAVFAAASPWITLLVALVMVGFAGHEIRARQERRLAGPWGYALGAGAMTLAGTIVTAFALASQIQPTPWWSPQFALPLFGMVLGNTMTGVSLGLDALHGMVGRERRAIEAQLLLGHTRLAALLPVVRRALRSGFTPIINAMAATGVVSLPGMMTGQILSGVDPQEAVKYQLLIMFLIGGATGLGVLGAVIASARRLTDHRQRLRLDRLAPAPGR
ncbi:iron export ABC transporter permease subunit FetB [Limibaculum sp. M0105]|uniref:Iron export ABC transporter permease subunit FetB n=1 Tax=Thermohalobaculum xanthum TaxID=2753746 RepID=A0A8J7SE46_9RHOB|nr:iron export ABC transporter permease subunit FetB [Thermohalobaculum xanthum]MBK0400457.1 iron export ABC transporter permease subunit FetB [Thermohalobaculum xanthum]